MEWLVGLGTVVLILVAFLALILLFVTETGQAMLSLVFCLFMIGGVLWAATVGLSEFGSWIMSLS